ncbi:unnamed protein product [Euphydryas editha]|uniref:Uncharacterized protein n=1 Tax=Euphydryas editha TaxID=104508 RepID=A0AAU9ULI1_EUPED|nr:unnamed protein product [Euphydryas editha]
MRTRRRRKEGLEEKTRVTSMHTEMSGCEGRSGRASDLRGSFRARYGDEAAGAHLVRALEGGSSGPGTLATRAAAAVYATIARPRRHAAHSITVIYSCQLLQCFHRIFFIYHIVLNNYYYSKIKLQVP